MDVTFVCSGEEAFKMEVGYFDTVQDVKEKLQSRRGWPAAASSLLHNGALLEDDVDGGGGGGSGIERHGVVEGSVIHVALLDGAQHQQQPQQNKRTEKRKRRGDAAPPSPPLRVTVVSRCGEGRVEVAVGARAAVSVLRAGRGCRSRSRATAPTSSYMDRA
ncbi:unnamed protein product [Miscanthus lutarioriparius]|uniref:Ubiquitin-like domain-containing protein n=1 Tax=Miscanthus lutarioriparius TaxID=422564 RepID=A0A811NMF7_9POAL|nr:unnamed protein product [Miscanthus lutarioriparius]